MKSAKRRYVVRFWFADGTSLPVPLEEVLLEGARQERQLGIEDRSDVEIAVEEGRRIERAIKREQRSGKGRHRGADQPPVTDHTPAIRAAIADNPTLSNREIARLVGCSETSVRRYKKPAK